MGSSWKNLTIQLGLKVLILPCILSNDIGRDLELKYQKKSHPKRDK